MAKWLKCLTGDLMVPGLSPIMTQNFLSLRVYSALPLLEGVFASAVLRVGLVREASHILVKTEPMKA